jgi:hypothetical protein
MRTRNLLLRGLSGWASGLVSLPSGYFLEFVFLAILVLTNTCYINTPRLNIDRDALIPITKHDEKKV